MELKKGARWDLRIKNILIPEASERENGQFVMRAKLLPALVIA